MESSFWQKPFVEKVCKTLDSLLPSSGISVAQPTTGPYFLEKNMQRERCERLHS